MKRALLLALAFAALAVPQAQAAPGVQYGLTDDAWLQQGPGTLDSRLAQLDRLGVRVVRYTVRWDAVAPAKPVAQADPTDPAYDWTTADAVLDGLRAHGIQPIVQLYGSPGWANGGKPANYAPTSATAMRAFATAAGRHYPWVKRWVIWNEPNQVRWLRPTSAAVYTSRLLNPAYAALHSAVPGVKVAGGGTAPRGSTGGVSPVAWLAGMHAAHARLDAYAHNPYPLDPKRESPLHGGCARCTTITMATIGRLVSLVAKDFPSARIWLTEYGYQSNPPDRFLGVSQALQARYVSEGAYAAYRTPRVDILIHFLYRDEPDVARFQSGLLLLSGKAKPAYAAFELPLAETMRSGTHVSLWGQLRAPGTGSSGNLQQQVGSAWRTIATVRRGAGGFFRVTVTLPPHAVVRVAAGSVVGAPLTT